MKKCSVCGKEVLSGSIVCKACSCRFIDTFEDKNIVVEKARPTMPEKDSFYIYFGDKVVDWNTQDICCIQKDKTTGKLHVLVWGDCTSEDYTHDIVIDIYREPQEDEHEN